MQDLGAFGWLAGGIDGMVTDGVRVAAMGRTAWHRGGMGGMGGGMAMAEAAAPMAAAPMARWRPPVAAEPRSDDERRRLRGQSDGRGGSLRSSPSSAPTSPTPPSGPPPSPPAADGTAEVEFPLPESLTTWKVKTLDDGPGHQGRPGRVRDRHDQGPARPAPGAPVLRREGRGRALGQRPQQAQDQEVRPGRAGARRQRACSRWARRRGPSRSPRARSTGSTGG